ncbi:MAG TPA: PP2C family protein-serine/threonine phosphatase [Tepidisphaeraceae bacterium]|jgi:serine phosphatase RsbU (regulator of sigma subunit)|nr:PP2C family protein-serine/threonine phosphatase [Tepidisphaeraceae bacterium]
MDGRFQATRIMSERPTAEGIEMVLVEKGESAAPHLKAGTPGRVMQQFDDVQREMDALRLELNLLRRRDDTINYNMNRLDEELRLAARLQRDFLPKSLPQLGAIRFHTLFRPAGYVSGDLYDVMRLDEQHVGFYIADAVGHGMPAALLTMFLKHALVTKEIYGGGYRLLKPSESMARLNESFIDQNLAHSTFATAIYGMINVRTLELTIACAGHPMPVLLPEAGPMKNLPATGGLLGIFPGETYTDFTTQLSPGDRLILYTDGVEVAFGDDPSTGDPERWRQELVDRRLLPSATLLSAFSECADKESGSLEPKDDLTMVMIEVGRSSH